MRDALRNLFRRMLGVQVVGNEQALAKLHSLVATIREEGGRVEQALTAQVGDSVRILERRQKQVESKVSQLLQQNREQRLLLKRLQNLLERPGRAESVIGPALPYTVDSGPDPTGSRGSIDSKPEIPAAHEIRTLNACPACSCGESTVVCEYNKFIQLGSAPDDAAKRYDYALCHACGIVYATRRPEGRRFRYLLEHFSETIGRLSLGARHEGGNPVLNPYPLSESDKAVLDRLIERGVFVSDHLVSSRKEYLSGAFRDRMTNSPHVELLGSLLSLERPRVLDIRSRTGSMLDMLRRQYGADVYALPMFESQQYVVQHLYGIRADVLIDFDHFSIPFDETFDVIMTNHMFTHILRPDVFFGAIRASLKPGGHVYLYNEPDDSEYLFGGQSMFNVLNPFHLQAFDSRSLTRALSAFGFTTKFIGHLDGDHVCLIQMTGRREFEPMPAQELDSRLEAYRKARDFAILRAPETARPAFADEWEAVVDRAVAQGIANIDAKGVLRVLKGIEA